MVSLSSLNISYMTTRYLSVVLSKKCLKSDLSLWYMPIMCLYSSPDCIVWYVIPLEVTNMALGKVALVVALLVCFLHVPVLNLDRLWDLLVRVPGYRSRGLGLIPCTTRFSEKQWVWNVVQSASWVQLRNCLKGKVAALYSWRDPPC
jgi:hypothetical protein